MSLDVSQQILTVRMFVYTVWGGGAITPLMCVCVYYCTTAKYKFYYKTLLIAWPNLLEVNKVCFNKTIVLILSLQGFQIREDFCNISFLFPRYWDSIGFNNFFNSAQI